MLPIPKTDKETTEGGKCQSISSINIHVKIINIILTKLNWKNIKKNIPWLNLLQYRKCMKDLLYTYKINATLFIIYLGKEITWQSY